MIYVPNQLVGAPVGTNVTIECNTEAYPRAISYWTFNGSMVLSTDKYVAETIEIRYKTDMRLTIRNLQPGDFGSYRCISKNSLGETEGSIRLYSKRFKAHFSFESRFRSLFYACMKLAYAANIY